MTMPYEYECEIDEPTVASSQPEGAPVFAPVLSDLDGSSASAGSFLDRARNLARANAGRPSLRVSGARVGDVARPVDTADRRLPTKRLGLRINSSSLGRRGSSEPDDSGEGVA